MVDEFLRGLGLVTLVLLVSLALWWAMNWLDRWAKRPRRPK
jgi:hypothetical protein